MVKLTGLTTAFLLVAGVSLVPGQSRPRSVNEWLSQLDSTDGVEEARAHLVAMGDAAVDPVTNAILNVPDEKWIRAAVLVGILHRVGTPAAITSLTTLLNHHHATVREWAASSLSRLQGRCATPLLLPLLKDSAYAGELREIHSGRTQTFTVADKVAEMLKELSGLDVVARKTAEERHALIENWWRATAASPCRGA